MTKSIMQDEKECLICGTTYDLQRHHVFEGIGRRKTSERFGCWVWLCARHHTGDKGIHFNKEADLRLKRECQKRWEARFGSRTDFIIYFTRSYL